MNLAHRLGPYLYATLHSYNTAWELMLGPQVRRIARRDRDRLIERFPALRDYQQRALVVNRRLAGDYADYTRNVSPGSIAVALELAVFMTVLCEITTPAAILDLGSGFSSYAFRQYARAAGAAGAPTPAVYSVDDSEGWLDITRGFLQRRGLDTRNLLTLQSFQTADRPPFDLVLHDFGQLPMRLALIEQVVQACRPGGMIVIDDMHVPSYRQAMIRRLDRLGVSHFSLRPFTRKRMRYSYLAIR